jgi:hypothetical protein
MVLNADENGSGRRLEPGCHLSLTGVSEAASPIVVNTIGSRVKLTSILLGNGHSTLQPEARYAAGFIPL